MAVRPDAKERLPESGALTDELDALDTALTELRARYEQYFLGVDRHPPTKAYDTTRQRLGRLRALFVRSAALKFRIQALQQRFTTYDRLWQRTLTEMENGTYQRDLFKARRRRKTEDGVPAVTTGVPAPLPPAPAVPPPGAPATAAPAPGVAQAPIPTVTQGGTVRPSPVPSVAPVALPTGTQGGVVRPPPLPTTPPRGPPSPIPQGTQGGVAAAAAAALAEPRLRAVYEAYLTAKKSCQEDVSRLSFESVADSLRKQVPELLERHGARDVEYKVVVKDGKAVLRAVPKG